MLWSYTAHREVRGGGWLGQSPEGPWMSGWLFEWWLDGRFTECWLPGWLVDELFVFTVCSGRVELLDDKVLTEDPVWRAGPDPRGAVPLTACGWHTTLPATCIPGCPAWMTPCALWVLCVLLRVMDPSSGAPGLWCNMLTGMATGCGMDILLAALWWRAMPARLCKHNELVFPIIIPAVCGGSGVAVW